MKHSRKGFDFGNFEITKREILASFSIVAVMLLIGFLISGRISEVQMDKNEKYNKAAKIESQEIFQYAMDTNIGNAFVYGDLEAIDTVTYPEIGGEYMYVEKVEEHYNMHTRTVTTTDGKGHCRTHTQVYWTWDYAGSEDMKCKEIKFCGVTFPSEKINLPSKDHIGTIKTSSHVRFVYYGVGTKYTGTIFSTLKDRTISDSSSFYNNKNIEETVDYLESNVGIIIFWIVWIIIICIAVYAFYYADNRWLE